MLQASDKPKWPKLVDEYLARAICLKIMLAIILYRGEVDADSNSFAISLQGYTFFM